MKRIVFGLAILSSVVFFSGCLVADQRLPANDTPTVDSPLVGLWQLPWPAMQTRESLNISHAPGQDYYVAVRGRGKFLGQDSNQAPIEIQETYSYKAYPARIGSRAFFSIISSKRDIPAYTLVEAVLEDGGKRLVLREPTDEAVERAFGEGKLSFRIQEDSKVATSSPELLAGWIGSLPESDFKVHEVFERWPAPVDDLQKRING